MPSIPRRRRPLGPEPDLPFVGGTQEPSSATIASRHRPQRAWPSSLLGRLSFSRRIVRNRRSQAEANHIVRLTTVAAARDIGENAPALANANGLLELEPPHREVSRTRFARALEGRTGTLSNAITASTRTSEQVVGAEREAARAREDMSAARESMPAPPAATGNAGTLVWLLAILAFTGVEMWITKTLWENVIDNTQLGVYVAGMFAIVFAFGTHVFATWMWSLADEYGRLRAVSVALVAMTIASVFGLLLVIGFERDAILVDDRVQKVLSKERAADAQAAANAVIASNVTSAAGGAAAAGPQAGGGAGLVGALGGGGAPAAGAPATTAPPSSGGLTGSVPGAPAAPAAPATTRARGERSVADARSADDVGFKFLVWLNFFVFFVLVLFTRGRMIGGPYRAAGRRLGRLQKRDGKARDMLRAAEAARQDAAVGLDEAARTLYPLAERCNAEEVELDRLFIDQVRRSAIAAGHGRVNVRLTSEPPDLQALLETAIGADIPTMEPAAVRLGFLPYEHAQVVDGIAGATQHVDEGDPVSPFSSTRLAPEDGSETAFREARRGTRARRAARLRDLWTRMTTRADEEPDPAPADPAHAWAPPASDVHQPRAAGDPERPAHPRDGVDGRPGHMRDRLIVPGGANPNGTAQIDDDNVPRRRILNDLPLQVPVHDGDDFDVDELLRDATAGTTTGYMRDVNGPPEEPPA